MPHPLVDEAASAGLPATDESPDLENVIPDEPTVSTPEPEVAAVPDETVVETPDTQVVPEATQDDAVDYVDQNGATVRVPSAVATMLRARDEQFQQVNQQFNQQLAQMNERLTQLAPVSRTAPVEPTEDDPNNAFLKRFSGVEQRTEQIPNLAKDISDLKGILEEARHNQNVTSTMASVKQTLSHLRSTNGQFKNEHVASKVEADISQTVENFLRANPKAQINMQRLMQGVITDATAQAKTLNDIIRASSIQTATQAKDLKGKTVPTSTGGGAVKTPDKKRINYGDFNEHASALADSFNRHMKV